MNTRGEYESETYIRDPIYNEIGLSSLELDILDEPAVQRLRHINQLGPVSRVYPSATHTRFSHSLGVMNVAGKIGNKIGLCDREITEARIAGLLHDVGHGPFSHTSELVSDENVFNHEDRSCEIARDICSDYPVNKENIVNYIRGESTPSIIAGTIDADRLDYILRDSLYTSLNHGVIDVDSIIRFSCEIDGKLGFDVKAIPTLNDLLSARIRMRQVVYRYNTVRHFTALVRRAMEEYVENNSMDDMIDKDDYSMHTELVDTSNKFYNKVIERKLDSSKLSYSLDDLSKNELLEISKISNETIRSKISERLNINSDNIIISSPYIPENIPNDIIIRKSNNDVVALSQCSKFPNYIQKEAWNSTSLNIYIYNSDNCTKSEIQEVITKII